MKKGISYRYWGVRFIFWIWWEKSNWSFFLFIWKGKEISDASDEVTSALDYDTKVDIENTIFELQDVTVLYIAHSITENIRTKADKILSMEG